MPTSTLTSKGQITLPKPIRDHLHASAGDQVDFVIAANGEVVMHRVTGSVVALAGLLHQPRQRTVSVEEMDKVIASAVVEKVRRR